MKHKSVFGEVISILYEERFDAIIGIFTNIGVLLIEKPQESLLLVFLLLPSFFLLTRVIGTTINIYQQTKEKNLPIVVDVGHDLGNMRDMREKAFLKMKDFKFDIKAYDKFFNIEQEDITIHCDHYLGREEVEWKNLVSEYKKKIQTINPRLRGTRYYHHFLRCPSALALGMGAVNGTINMVVVYQYNGNQYWKVVDLRSSKSEEHNTSGIHIVKTQVSPPFEYIEVVEPSKKKKDIYIALGLASHSPNSNVASFMESINTQIENVKGLAENQGAALTIIKNTYNNTLDLEKDDWLKAAREVNTVIKRYAEDQRSHSIHLFLSCPVALAYTIGMGLGTQSAITIYQWFAKDQQYHPIFRLNELAS